MHKVFHGSGADFDAFDHSHMGEGAQAYGWGSYVTEVEVIGRAYAKENPRYKEGKILYKGEDVSKQENFSLLSEAFEEEPDSEPAEIIATEITDNNKAIEVNRRYLKNFEELETGIKIAYEYLKGLNSQEWEDLCNKNDLEIKRFFEETNNNEDARDFLNEAIDYSYSQLADFAGYSIKDCEHEIKDREYRITEIQDYIEFLNSLEPSSVTFIKPELSRYLYTVDIPTDNSSNYIDWNKTSVRAVNKMLKAMTDDQKERISEIPVSKYNDGSEILGKEDLKNRILWHIHNSGWKNLYEIATIATGDKQAASELLSRAGFVGIKYPAEFRSGGREDNAMNYIIFNENDLKITDKMRFFRTADGQAFGYTFGF